MATTASAYVSPSSRYVNSKVIQYTENRLLTFETYKKANRVSLFSASDQWMEIEPAYEYRPDLVSVEIYGTPDFWWRILESNGMKDIMEFKAGVTIRLIGNVFF